MEKQELIQYLTQAYTLESKVYEQQGLIERLEQRQRIAECDPSVWYEMENEDQSKYYELIGDVVNETIPDNISEYDKLDAQIRTLEQLMRKHKDPEQDTNPLTVETIDVVAVGLSFIPAFGGCAVLYINMTIGIATVGVGIVAIIASTTAMIRRITAKEKARKEAYEKACADARAQRQQINEQIDNLKEQKNQLGARHSEQEKKLTSELQSRLLSVTLPALAEAQPVLDTLESTLEQLYSLNIIFPKYRSFACVATLLEYLQSGRCDELTGPNGAYNLYESELRSDLIITKLDNIERKLDQVIANQHTLYYAINQANKRLDKITTQLDKSLALQKATAINTAITAANTAITASCTAAIAANTEALKYIALVR
jgi:hypothetical protein